MIKNIAIEVKNLTKIYKLYNHPSEILKELILKKPYHTEFMALDNISFSINKGEVVGIIGRNGSGKSTLLKIIAGSLDKTSGQMRIHGKLSAILDLGLGFNPEYTGRENIYNGGIILGMSRKEIDKKMKSIIEFSELEEFIDRPFKTYSAGMQARLTFSVAAAIEPEILIIDEALSAGDSYFMAKCMDRITEMCHSGATVLFVSHSTPTVQKLCTRTIWLDKGKLVMDGSAFDVCQLYETEVMREISLKLKKDNVNFNHHKALSIKKKEEPICIKNLKLLDKHGKEMYTFFQNDHLTIRIFYKSLKALRNISPWISIYRSDGIIATSVIPCIPYQDLGIFNGEGYVDFIWNEIYLGEADYLISCGFYPYKKNKPLGMLPLESYAFHDKKYKFKIKSKLWPLMSVYEQPTTILHYSKKTDKYIKKKHIQNAIISD